MLASSSSTINATKARLIGAETVPHALSYWFSPTHSSLEYWDTHFYINRCQFYLMRGEIRLKVGNILPHSFSLHLMKTNVTCCCWWGVEFSTSVWGFTLLLGHLFICRIVGFLGYWWWVDSFRSSSLCNVCSFPKGCGLRICLSVSPSLPAFPDCGNKYYG